MFVKIFALRTSLTPTLRRRLVASMSYRSPWAPHLLSLVTYSLVDMPKKRVFDVHRRDPRDGTQLRSVLTPNGKTSVGVQSFVATPGGEHQAWMFMRPGEKEAHAQDNSQAVKNARKKARRETEMGKPARTSLALRAEALHIGSVGLNM